MKKTYNIYSEQLYGHHKTVLDYDALTLTLLSDWDYSGEWDAKEIGKWESVAQMEAHWSGMQEGICLFDRRTSFPLEPETEGLEANASHGS